MLELFISNIDYKVTKACLYDLLIQVAPVKHLKYKTKIAFVDYFNVDDCKTAFKILNGISLYGRPIVIQTVEKSVFVEVCCSFWCDLEYLNRLFKKFGSCKLKKIKRKIFCIYRRQVDADRAVQEMNKKVILGNIFRVQIV